MTDNLSAARQRAEQAFAQVSEPAKPTNNTKETGSLFVAANAVDEKNRKLRELRMARDAAKPKG